MLKLLQIHIKLLCSILILLGSLSPVLGQKTNFRYYEYNKQNKLNEELVKSIKQDSLGLYYFATDGGVYSLINDKFNLLEQPKEKSHYFKELFKLKDGRILAVSDDAIYRINPSFNSHKMELLVECNIDPAAPKYPKHIYQDSKQRIWISDYNHLYRLNNQTIEKYAMDKKNLTSSYARSFQFLECNNGNLAVISQKGWIYNYNNKTNSFDESDYHLDLLIHSSFKIGANEFLLGTSKGIVKILFDENGSVISHQWILKDIIASCFEQIDSRRLLVGTWFQGMLEIDLKSDFRFYAVSGFPYFTVNDLYKDQFGKFWASTNSGVVVMEEKFFNSQFLTANSEYVAKICRDGRGQLYFADRNNIYNITEKQQLENLNIPFKGTLATFKKYKDLYLIGTENGELYLYKNNELIKSIQSNRNTILDIEFDSENFAWVVADKELLKINLKKGSIKSYFENFNNKKIVQDICMLDNHTLFVGGEHLESYLFRYDRKKDAFINLSKILPEIRNVDFWIRDMEPIEDTLYIGTSSGLFKFYDSKITEVDLGDMEHGEINAVTVDNFNAIWVTTSKGVIRKKGEDISLFTPDQGLPSKTFTIGNILVDNSGFLWVGTSNGLAYAHVSDSIPKTPKPFVIAAKDEKYIPSQKHMKVTAGSMLLLDVSATIYPQKQNQFQYCIVKGTEQIVDWKDLSDKNQVIVSNLDPGEYRICIRAKHEGNYTWSKPRNIPLTVKQVWYLRWYTIVFELGMILLLVYLSSEYSKRKAKQHMIELEKEVTERTVQLQDANQNLLLANKSKDRFLSIIGHDLRNPFNAIRGFSKMLIQDADLLSEEETKELIEMIYKSSDDTFKLLESLLEWANVQKGNFKLNKEVFDLAEIMETNLELHKNLASIKEIKVVGKFGNVMVDADKAMVNTVIRNLLSNAIKFSYSGQTITLISVKKENTAIVQVKDEGMGMTPEQLDNLFKIDHVVTSEGTANESGTGFGLMLCKEFVEINGGEIKASSEKGKGTSFFFSIPLAK